MTTLLFPLLEAQLNLDNDPDEILLMHKIATAEASIVSYIGAPLPDPAPIVEACIQLVVFW